MVDELLYTRQGPVLTILFLVVIATIIYLIFGKKEGEDNKMETSHK